MRITPALAVFILLRAAESIMAQTVRKTIVPEQLIFNAEESVKNPITIPDEVLAVMKGDRFVQENLEN